MSNLMKELKVEVARLARKEVKKELAAVKKINASQRGLIAELRRQVNVIQKDLNGLKKAVPSHKKAILEKKEPQGRFWISGKGVKTMRKRVGLTQAKFSELIGVSVPTVVNWEKTVGKVEIRKKASMARLQGLKGKGKREVAAMLAKDTKKGSRRKAKKA